MARVPGVTTGCGAHEGRFVVKSVPARMLTRLRLRRVMYIEAAQPGLLLAYAVALSTDHLPREVEVVGIADAGWAYVVAALALAHALGLVGVATGWYYSSPIRSALAIASVTWWSALGWELAADGRYLHSAVMWLLLVGGTAWALLTRLEAERALPEPPRTPWD